MGTTNRHLLSYFMAYSVSKNNSFNAMKLGFLKVHVMFVLRCRISMLM